MFLGLPRPFAAGVRSGLDEPRIVTRLQDKPGSPRLSSRESAKSALATACRTSLRLSFLDRRLTFFQESPTRPNVARLRPN